MINIPPTHCIICGSKPFAINLNNLNLWKCQNCELMWRALFDVPLSHYGDAEGGFSKDKEKLQRRNIRDRIRTIGKYVKLDNTCDIGGSKGYFVEGLISFGYKGAYGVDPNKIQVEKAIHRGTPMIVGSTKDIHKIFPEKKTQNVSLFHVIEHLPDPVKTITEIYNALPSGGHFVVETPDFDSYSFKKLNYNHKLVYNEHLFYFNFDNLPQFLEKIGFSIIYAGKRDFDQYHLNLRESLFRLELMKRDGNLNILQRTFFKLMKIFFTVPASLLVKMLGRGNFILVIAQKS